jgi:cob(I)alamin adenosyltransferase
MATGGFAFPPCSAAQATYGGGIVPHAKDETREQATERTGLVMVFTGNGKGKTTAALGSLFRAWGWGWRTCVIQFMKCEGGDWGEVRAAKRLGIEWHTMGAGFTWQLPDKDAAARRAREAWALAQERISSGDYDLVILDEMTYAFTCGWLDLEDVISWLASHRPQPTSLIITGRGAPERLIEFADLVTEMREVKHPYESGLEAQQGIEY